MTADLDSRFFPVKPDVRARLRLFCFPHAGVGASMFHSWSAGLPPEIQVFPIQLPGRESRRMDPSYTTLFPLVEKLTVVLPPYMDVPFALFGHSMGGLIAFELARAVRSLGRPFPVHLLVSGCRAPRLPRRSAPICSLPEPDFVIALCERYGGIPAAILEDDELLRLFLPILRSDLGIVETYAYSPGEALDCPIAAFGGLQDRSLSRDELAAWSVETRSSFTLHSLPGDHFFVNSSRAVLLRRISDCLEPHVRSD